MKKYPDRQDVKNLHQNYSDRPLNTSRYRLYPMDLDVGGGFRIGDMVIRNEIVGFLSNLDPNDDMTKKPFAFTTLDPKSIPDGHYSHGQFCSLDELTLLADEVDNQEVADLFGINVEDLP